MKFRKFSTNMETSELNIIIGGNEEVNSFRYLGSKVRRTGRCKARIAFLEEGNINDKNRLGILDCLKHTYRSESWT